MDAVDKRTDYELVQAYRSGEQQVFKTLLERHKQKVYNYIFSLVKDKAFADDIFQDTFVKVINTLRGGAYHDEGKFIQWVMRIAHNLVIDHIRKNQKVRMVYSNDDYNVFDVLDSAEQNCEDKMIKKRYTKIFVFLSSSYQKNKDVCLL